MGADTLYYYLQVEGNCVAVLSASTLLPTWEAVEPSSELIVHHSEIGNDVSQCPPSWEMTIVMKGLELLPYPFAQEHELVPVSGPDVLEDPDR